LCFAVVAHAPSAVVRRARRHLQTRLDPAYGRFRLRRPGHEPLASKGPARMSTPCQLTPELESQILAGIRAGGFPHVAAAAFGVPRRVFRRWLSWGKRRRSAKYESFAHQVAQAHATARLNAEINTHKKDPRLWLRAGPGKEKPGAVGWT